MDMTILAEILRRRKMKGPDELSKYVQDMDDKSAGDVKEVKEIILGNADMSKYKKSGDSSIDSTDEMAPSHAEIEDINDNSPKIEPEDNQDVEVKDPGDDAEKEKFKETLKKEVRPFSKKRKGVDDEETSAESDEHIFSEKDYKDAASRKESGRKLGLFDRVQLNIGKRKNK